MRYRRKRNVTITKHAKERWDKYQKDNKVYTKITLGDLVHRRLMPEMAAGLKFDNATGAVHIYVKDGIFAVLAPSSGRWVCVTFHLNEKGMSG
jgi:hypothetical protein